MSDEYTDPPSPPYVNGLPGSPAGEYLSTLVDWNSPAWDSYGRVPAPITNKRRPANPLRRDPSRTLTLRRAFCTRLRKKFALLRGRIIRLVVDEDALGLNPPNPLGNSNLNQVRLDNAFCATGVGGGIDATCSPGESTAGALYERATTAARGVLRKFSEAYGKVTDRPVLRQLKRTGDYLGKKTKDLYGALETRYGRKQAMAIMASAQVAGWGALGVGAAIGVPLYLPGVSIWGTLPAVALAEGYLQAKRVVGKVKVALTGNEETDDYGTLGPRGVAGEARKLVSDLREAYLVYLRSQAPNLRGVLAANCNPGQLRDATSGRCGPGVGVSIPRAEMPQIRGEDVAEFVRWVRSQGVGVGEETIDPGDLAPTQREFRQERVDAIPTEKLRDPLIISRDSYILDGTHRWVKAWQDDRPTLSVLRIDLDLDDALDLMRRFPGARFVENEQPRGKVSSTDEGHFSISPRSPTANAGLGTPSPSGRWATAPDHERVKKFQEWLRQQYEELLDGDDDEALWAKFVEDGYRKGAGRAYDDAAGKAKKVAGAEEVGLALPPGGTTSLEFKLGGKSQFLRTALGAPERVSKVKLLAGRAFDELEDVTADMSLKMSRVLADGLVKGEGPATVARALTDQVGLGQTRAETIAQTELLRAHNDGQLDGLEDLGVEDVGVAVEWEVTEDEALCELCAEMDGVVLTIDEARGMLPRHPRCRCCWVPANVGEDDKDQQRTRGEITRAIKASRAEAGDDEEDDDWGPAVPVAKDRPKSILNQSAVALGKPSARALNSFCATGQGGGVDPSCGAGGGMTRQEQAVKEAYTAAYGPSSKTLKPRERSAAVDRYKTALRDWTAAEGGHSEPFGGTVGSATTSSLSQETPGDAVRLTKTFRRLDREQGGHNFVHLGHLRAAHPELSREQFDGAVRHARQEGALTLSPAEGRHGITAHDRLSALEENNPATPGRKDLMLYVSARRLSNTTNAFCPTGPGGGVNPHCSPGGHDLSTGAGLTAHLQATQRQHGLTALGLRKIQHLNPQGIQSGVLYVYGSPNKAKADALAAKLRGILPAQTIIKVRTGISAKTLSSARGVPAPVPSPQPSQSSRLPTVPYTHEVKWGTGKAEPGTLNGVDFAPAPPKFWEHTPDKDLKEPDAVRPISRASVMIQEPDGRVWIVQPTNAYGQRNHTLPGGTIEPGLTHQQNALKEVWEETGLQVEVTGHLGDFEDSNTGRIGRLYVGRRIGGAPWDAKIEDGSHGGPRITSRKTGQPAAESETVTLVTKERAAQLLHRTDDLAQLATVHPIPLATKTSGKMMQKLVEGLKPAADQYTSSRRAAGRKAGDGTLRAVQDLRGYNGQPRVVSKAAMDTLVGQGTHIEMLRGIQGSPGTPAMAMADEFRTGEHYPGYGCFGNGTYADAKKGSGNVATGQYGAGGEVVRMALPRTARIIKQSELEKLVRQCPSGYQDGHHHSSSPGGGLTQGWWGVHAALAGYDAIHVDGGSTIHGRYGSLQDPSNPHDYHVILNRSILVVQRTSAKGHVIQ